MKNLKRTLHIIKHKKRFVLRFYNWWYEYTDKKCERSKIHLHSTDEEFDTREEVNEIMKLYDELYKDTPRPIKKSRVWNDNIYVAEHIDYQNGEAKYWGYILLDFEEKKIVNVYHDKLSGWEKWKTNLNLMDELFGEENDIPEDYEWDDGEWEGWLQFKWGNGLNAIEVEDEINRKKAEKAKIEYEKRMKEKAEQDELIKKYEEIEAERLNNIEEDYEDWS